MNILYHIIRIILSLITILTLIRNEKIYPPNKQNKVYHLTNPNTNPIHLITNPGILHI